MRYITITNSKKPTESHGGYHTVYQCFAFDNVWYNAGRCFPTLTLLIRPYNSEDYILPYTMPYALCFRLLMLLLFQIIMLIAEWGWRLCRGYTWAQLGHTAPSWVTTSPCSEPTSRTTPGPGTGRARWTPGLWCRWDYWSWIGPDWSRDLDTGLWLDESCQMSTDSRNSNGISELPSLQLILPFKISFIWCVVQRSHYYPWLTGWWVIHILLLPLEAGLNFISNKIPYWISV